jgi:quercetin dioxygenase-like cupin family protein
MPEQPTTSIGPRLLKPDDGSLMGATAGRKNRYMIGSADTQGRFSLVEHVLAPQVLAAPMHYHTREDEFSFVLEGRVGAILDGHEIVAEAGELLFKPRGQWHTFWNAGDSTVRILELISPAGLDDLFRQHDSLDGFPEPDVLAKMAEAYGCAIDLAATLPVIERHGLLF